MKRARLIIAIIFLAIPFVILSVLTIVLGSLLRAMKLRRASEKTVHFLLIILIRWIFICVGLRLHTEGRENIPAWGTKVCYISNHQSMMDIPVLYGAGMWCGLVAKAELFRIPLLRHQDLPGQHPGTVGRQAGAIFRQQTFRRLDIAVPQFRIGHRERIRPPFLHILCGNLPGVVEVLRRIFVIALRTGFFAETAFRRLVSAKRQQKGWKCPNANWMRFFYGTFQ